MSSLPSGLPHGRSDEPRRATEQHIATHDFQGGRRWNALLARTLHFVWVIVIHAQGRSEVVKCRIVEAEQNASLREHDLTGLVATDEGERIVGIERVVIRVIAREERLPAITVRFVRGQNFLKGAERHRHAAFAEIGVRGEEEPTHQPGRAVLDRDIVEQ